MRINLVYAADFQLPSQFDPAAIEKIGKSWGSWKTWRLCETDNVLCHDIGKARELYKRALQAVCDLYVPESFYQAMSRPTGIHFYRGEFNSQVQDIEDIIAMHLVAPVSDLVILLGFDLASPGNVPDVSQATMVKHRLGLLRECVKRYPNTQWILVDHAPDIDKAFGELPNLTRDSLANVINLLA